MNPQELSARISEATRLPLRPYASDDTAARALINYLSDKGHPISFEQDETGVRAEIAGYRVEDATMPLAVCRVVLAYLAVP